MINGFINGQDLRLSQPKIVADTIDYLEAVFKFQTADWDGLEKWAHFQKGDVVYDVMLENDKISKDKHLNLTAGYWYVYLHGNAFQGGQMVQRITTDIAKLAVEQSGVLDGDPLPLVPPSVAGQLSARIANLENGGSVGGGLDGLSIYTGTTSFSGTTMILPQSVNVPYGRTLQAGDLIVDNTGAVFSVTSADDTLVYIENTNVNLKGADGYGILPCGTNAPTINGATATVLINFFHLPDGYTLRVGDTAVGSNGYIAKVTAISGSNVTLTGTGISIKGADGSGGSITVDSEFSDTSENPVQNKVITQTLYEAMGMLEQLAQNVPPTVTTADNGKILQVVDGAWVAVEIATWGGGDY